MTLFAFDYQSSDTRQVESSANRSEGGSVQENYDYFAQSESHFQVPAIRPFMYPVKKRKK